MSQNNYNKPGVFISDCDCDCDFLIADSFKTDPIYIEARKDAKYLDYECFDYIHQFEERRDTGGLDANGIWLIRKFIL